jgi:hypothetical protein
VAASGKGHGNIHVERLANSTIGIQPVKRVSMVLGGESSLLAQTHPPGVERDRALLTQCLH